PLSIWFYSI
ncbi:conserved hypothetical integral membrane family protein, partial [Vibrio parahaemolyticus V-223/04]